MRFIAATTAAALVLTACGSTGSSGAGGSDAPFRVLITGGLSAAGVLAANAQTSVLAAKAGVEDINKAGGIGGRKVELTVVDDAGDVTTAVTKLREALASDSKPDVFLNSGPSTVASATLPILKQNKVLAFNIGPTKDSADPKQFPLNFDIAPGPVDQLRGFVAHIKQKGYTSVGVIHGNSAYGQTFGAQTQQALSAAGIPMVGNEQYDVSSLDMTPQLQNLQAKNPQALIVDGYGAPVGYLLQSLQKLGWNVPLLGNTSVSATSLVSSPPPAGVLGTPQVANLLMEVFKSTSFDPADQKVNAMVTTMSGLGKIPGNLVLAYNYDVFAMLAAAAKDAGSTDGAALAKSLEKPEVQQAAGTAVVSRYHFSSTSHAPNADPDAFTFVVPSKVLNGQFGHPGA
ncbi:amino acid ABC transporter substrate-binding protein [Amycolatopsis rhizosphaerae]|uniref:Amino acid ABC transporter substrate-binding protein n=1 Tax=Amycolatopsis rhizosphaerae TaxID=2053003 RepID=A0A558DJY8_9PSEU|nr:ABC transporter substrate-binding protein [Amycolatopsis rhizosphaerae]TVT61328.1 amino acid ABC transporter substrate-binding protein [Amycolatopsis rhizosphaerae]